MMNRFFSFLYRLHLSVLTRRAKIESWDQDHSHAVDCLQWLMDYFVFRVINWITC